jgi:uncharacterized cupin superfamily protein
MNSYTIVCPQDNIPLAIYGNIKDSIKKDEQNFLGKPDFPFQAGVFNGSFGRVLKTHWHIPRLRLPLHKTQEFLYIVSGRVEATIFNNNRQVVKVIDLKAGDYIWLIDGGHGFRIMEDNTTFIETKSGQFTEVAKDKVYV